MVRDYLLSSIRTIWETASLRIVFVEPVASPKPVGGTRIVYEQANRLAERLPVGGLLVQVLAPRWW